MAASVSYRSFLIVRHLEVLYGAYNNVLVPKWVYSGLLAAPFLSAISNILQGMLVRNPKVKRDKCWKGVSRMFKSATLFQCRAKLLILELKTKWCTYLKVVFIWRYTAWWAGFSTLFLHVAAYKWLEINLLPAGYLTVFATWVAKQLGVFKDGHEYQKDSHRSYKERYSSYSSCPQWTWMLARHTEAFSKARVAA